MKKQSIALMSRLLLAFAIPSAFYFFPTTILARPIIEMSPNEILATLNELEVATNDQIAYQIGELQIEHLEIPLEALGIQDALFPPEI